MTSTTEAAVAVMLAEYGMEPPQVRAVDDPALAYGDAVVSERLVREALLGRWRWTAGMGWLRWDGVVWEPIEGAVVTEVARAWCVGLVAGVAASGDQQSTRVACGLLGGNRVKRVVELAQGQEGIRATAGDFDADPHLMVVGNGVVDLRTGDLHPHDPARLVTKCTRVNYRWGATCTAWDQALSAIPEDLREWMCLRLGQACTGHVPDDDRLCLFHGAGENGKSTFLAAVQSALGAYAAKVPDKVLLGSPSDHSTELMCLRGVRLAVIEETPEARRLAVARLKKIIGTDTIVAREVYRNNVEFRVTHTLVVSSNYLPVVEETDHGTWRRLALVKWPWKFVSPGRTPGRGERVGDPTLKPRMETVEARESVLAWMVEGAKRWYAANRVMASLPERVEADTLAWRTETDQVLGYITERLMPAPGRHVAAADLLVDMNGWLASKGGHEWSDRTLGARFGGHDWARHHGVERARPRSREGLSRPTGRAAALGAAERYYAWAGMRFRTAADDLADRGGPGGLGHSDLLSSRAREEGLEPPGPLGPRLLDLEQSGGAA